MPFVNGYVFGVAAPVNQRTNRVANPPATCVWAALLHDACHLETRNLPGWVGAVTTRSLENITSVNASRPYQDKNLARFGLWNGAFLQLKNRAIAGAGYTDCFHVSITKSRALCRGKGKTNRPENG